MTPADAMEDAIAALRERHDHLTEMLRFSSEKCHGPLAGMILVTVQQADERVDMRQVQRVPLVQPNVVRCRRAGTTVYQYRWAA